MQLSRKETFPALTGLRFVAALSVAIGHALPNLFPIKDAPIPVWYSSLQSLPGIGMPLFFTLSGFVIYYNYSTILDERPATGLWRFFVARFSRLYPLFALVVIIDLVNKWGYQQLPEETAEALPYYLTLTQTWFYTVTGDRTLPLIFGHMPTVGWSISTEWFFYLAFPLICALVIRLRTVRACMVGMLVAVLVWGCGIFAVGTYWNAIDNWATGVWGPVAGNAYQSVVGGQSFLRWLLYLSPYFEIGAFVVGCIIAAMIKIVAPRPMTQREMVWGSMATVCALAFVVATYFYLYQGSGGVIFGAARVSGLKLVPGIAALIFCLARYDTQIARFFSSATMVRFGEASYSLYLLHLPIIMAFRWEAAPMRTWEIGIADLARAIPFAAALIGASLVSYEYFEMPAQRAIRRWFTPRRRSEGTTPSTTAQGALRP